MTAAMELAEEGGFDNVRLRDVAQRAGVAMGTLYARFRSKEDILVAVLEEEAEKLEELFATYPATDPLCRDRVYYYFAAVTQLMFTRPNFAKALLRAVATGNHETAGKVARYQGRLNALILAAMHGDGTGHPSTVRADREEEIAFLLQQIWFAALVGWMSGIRDEDDVLRQMNLAIDIVLTGATAG